MPSGLRRDLQQAAYLGAFVGLWSPWIIAELNRVLSWRWMRDKGIDRASERECSQSANAMMEILLPTFELIPALPPYPAAWESLEDQWDVPIWTAAKEGKANFVVSENSRDYPPADAKGRHIYEGVEYLPGHRFLAQFESFE